MDAIRQIGSYLIDAENLADNEANGFDGPTPWMWTELVLAIFAARSILKRIEHANDEYEAARSLAADRANDEAWEDGR